MLKVVLSYPGSEEERRRTVHSGSILIYPGSEASKSLCELAESMINEAFDGLDPEHAQEVLSVERFVEIVGPLKSRFTNASQTKERLRRYIIDMGADPHTTYFDVPRLRVVPHSGYLSAGVSYAYKAHRDIWYSSPTAQINWWLPVLDVTPERSMAFFPDYWDHPIPNTSQDFDYGEWVRVGRAAALSQISKDARKHPLPLNDPSIEQEFRFGARAGDAILFSAAHLHATVPNTSGATRFSTDFRTISLEDLRSGQGGPNVDCRARGTTLGDFLRVSDLKPLEMTQELEALS
jgi:hypothetical protein